MNESDNKPIEPANSTKVESAGSFYWTAFKTFFKIGAFTLGGGYAMIPIIKSEVVEKHKWIADEEFIDLIAVAQSCPGVFAANISIFIGLIALFFHRFMDIRWVAAMFRGIRPAVVALIAVPTFKLAKSANIRFSNCWIPIVTAGLIYLLGVNPVYIIIAAGLSGYIYGRIVKPEE